MNEIKVMVAEDMEIIREEFCHMIEEANGLQLVGEASCGKEIVALTEDIPVDVILMDIEMDKYHDGIEAAKIIMSKKPEIRIIFLTVHEDDETVFSAFTTGAVDYIVKVSEPEEILESIHKAVEGKSIIRPTIASKIRSEFSRLKKKEESLLLVFEIVSRLTPTERQLISLLLSNMKVTEIAKHRNVEVVTVKSQINLLLKKFGKRRTKEIVHLVKTLQLEYLFES